MNKLLTFGTDGIRAHADEFPFTPLALNALGKAIAQWAIEKYKTLKPGVLIGYDTRQSCPQIKNGLISGLTHFQLDIVDGGILPTPTVYQLIKDNTRFNVGIVISASHNPYYDNGIKLFDAKVSKLTKNDEEHIVTYFETWYAKEQYLHTTTLPQTLVETWTNAEQCYQKKITSYFPQQFLKGIKIVLDCANGATSHLAPNLFTQLGADVIAIANQPTGTNINEKCGALYPENLQKQVLMHHAHIGFAFDGDGDRLIVVNQSGQIKNGDDVLFLLLSLPEYASTPVVVSTVMSNQGLENALNKLHKRLIRTKVGDKYVAEALVTNNLPIGGEVSGHTIIKDHMPTSDGIFVALKILEAAIIHNNWNLTTFQAFPQILLNIPINNKKDLSKPPLSNIIASYEQKLTNGRVLVRYSGTEKILRIMIEAHTQELAQNTAKALAQELQQAFINN
jgi:phosphoglucosamine mutase